MDEKLLKNAVDGLTALIESELHAEDPLRFQRVTKLCSQAHSLVQMQALRVRMVEQPRWPGILGEMHQGAAMVNPVGGFEIAGENELQQDIGNGVQFGGFAAAHRRPEVDFFREVMATLKPLIPIITGAFERLCRKNERKITRAGYLPVSRRDFRSGGDR